MKNKKKNKLLIITILLIVVIISMIVGNNFLQNRKSSTIISTIKPENYSGQNIYDSIKPNGLGDINLDGVITIDDAQLVLKHALKITTLTSDQQTRADIDGNGIIELADAQLVLKYVEKEKTIEPNGLGDVNKDGVINDTDAELVLKHALKITTLTSDQQTRADVDLDDDIDLEDAQKLTQYVSNVKYEDIKVNGLGDVNNDGVINDADAQLVLDHALKITTLTSDQQTRADIDGNGVIELEDAQLLTQYINESKDEYITPNGLGDINNDGVITKEDAELVLSHSLLITTLTAEQQTRADIDGDGEITKQDAQLILKYVEAQKTIKPNGLGDINLDGVVNRADAQLVLNHALLLTTLTSEQQARADVDLDGDIDIDDAQAILQYALNTDGIIVEPDGNSTWSKEHIVTFLPESGWYTVGDQERKQFTGGDTISISGITGQTTIKVEYYNEEGQLETYITNPYYLDNSVTKVTNGINITVTNDSGTVSLQERTQSDGSKYFSGSYTDFVSATVNIGRGTDDESGLDVTTTIIEKVLEDNTVETVDSGMKETFVIDEYGTYKLTVTSKDVLENEDTEIYYLYLNEKTNRNSYYTVEYYYQIHGSAEYPTTATDSRTGVGVVGQIANASNSDKSADLTHGPYVFDENNANNVLSGIITESGDLVLKVYFKKQYTVSYLPGEHGTFETQVTEKLDYNSDTPGFNGEITGEDGYEFAGWNPTVQNKVTTHMAYTAQWEVKTNNDDDNNTTEDNNIINPDNTITGNNTISNTVVPENNTTVENTTIPENNTVVNNNTIEDNNTIGNNIIDDDNNIIDSDNNIITDKDDEEENKIVVKNIVSGTKNKTTTSDKTLPYAGEAKDFMKILAVILLISGFVSYSKYKKYKKY